MAVLGAALASSFASEPQPIGASASWTDGKYQFAGGTTPWALALALIDAALYLALLRTPPVDGTRPLPGLLRRFLAFCLDFMLAMLVLGPIIGLLPMFVEWHRTGVFAWTFARTTSFSTDIPITVLSTLITFAALLFYYAAPLLLRKPSPGACIAGYQVLPDENTTMSLRKALLRSLVGFGAMCTAYLAPFVARDRNQGKFWLDKVFGTQATLLR